MFVFLVSGISSPQEIVVLIFIGLFFTAGCIFLSLQIAAQGRKRLIDTINTTNQSLQTLVGAFDLQWIQPSRSTSLDSPIPASLTLGRVAGYYRDMKIEIGLEGNHDGDYRLVFSLDAAPGKQFQTKALKPSWAFVFHVTPSRITLVPRAPLITTWGGESYRILNEAPELRKTVLAFGDLATSLLTKV